MISGPKLPFKVRNSAMVTSPNGKGVVIFGGFNVNADQYSRYEWWMRIYDCEGLLVPNLIYNPLMYLYYTCT